MTQNLTSEDLRLLIQRVFQPGSTDKGLAIIVDLPDARLADNEDWAHRRKMAADWYVGLKDEMGALGLERLTLAWYRNAGGNNADLPATYFAGDGHTVFMSADDLPAQTSTFDALFRTHTMVMAPTELSATAPLKVATRDAESAGDGFRAATMPGFLPAMIPALRLDYGLINKRVNLLAGMLDKADRAEFLFETQDDSYELTLDLRHNQGHASGGLFPKNGIAGNLPSGEAYIVPYEGHVAGDESRSEGLLPVQIDDEVVLYRIEKNKAVAVLSQGPISEFEAERISKEPAYANMAELGLGVLGDFGLEPTGSILLDEKLGLHIAFGRSDHFGGTVAPEHFSSPDAVIHLDRVYIPATQPKVKVRKVVLLGADLEREIIRDDVFLNLD